MAFRDRRRPADEGKPFDPSKIDLVSLNASGDRVRIHIIADSRWTGSDEQLQSLQSKIHNYVGFALDGQLVRSYPETEGMAWEVVIDCRAGQPDPRTTQVLDQLTEGIRRCGGELVVGGGA